jgi:malonyl-CoA O-methyltransferase
VTLPAHAAYELWAETYPPVAHNPLMRVEQDVVAPLLAHLRAARALDVGTGSGRYLPLLKATGAATVCGVDFSLAMLKRPSTELKGGPSTELRAGPSTELRAGAATTAARICGDACRLPFRRGAFDLVNASLMIGDIADLGVWSREIARVLGPGGHLVYSDFHPSWAQRGWSRTFRSADGAMHDLSFNPHTVDEHLSALAAAGLRVRTIREPRFSAFRDAADPGIRAFRRRWGNPPVVVVFHAVKEP